MMILFYLQCESQLLVDHEENNSRSSFKGLNRLFEAGNSGLLMSKWSSTHHDDRDRFRNEWEKLFKVFKPTKSIKEVKDLYLSIYTNHSSLLPNPFPYNDVSINEMNDEEYTYRELMSWLSFTSEGIEEDCMHSLKKAFEWIDKFLCNAYDDRPSSILQNLWCGFIFSSPTCIKSIYEKGDHFRSRQSLPFLIKQSYELDSDLEDPSQIYPLVYVLYKKDWTRKDNVSIFNIEDIIKEGCLGSMALVHFMSDILYKIGHAPKYGA